MIQSAKLRTSRSKGILIYPYWPLQPWFQEVQRLSSFHFRLPPPHLCVRSHHPGIVEPFVNREVQLRAVVSSDIKPCNKKLPAEHMFTIVRYGL
jgi:hypothetical protein